MSETKEEIIRAVDLKMKESQNPVAHKSSVNELWNKIGDIQVRCPHCGKRQLARTTLKRKCVACNHTFQIVRKNEKSLIVHCDPKRIWWLHQVISLEHDGKYLRV